MIIEITLTEEEVQALELKWGVEDITDTVQNTFVKEAQHYIKRSYVDNAAKKTIGELKEIFPDYDATKKDKDKDTPDPSGIPDPSGLAGPEII